MKNFTKIDDMLNKNTLYQLFSSQVKVTSLKPIVDNDDVNENDGGKEEEQQKKDPILIHEQKSELDIAKRRKVRQDLVNRHWGSEAELTKAAYERINDGKCTEIINIPEMNPIFTGTLKELKEEIIRLKLIGEDASQERLQTLLSGFTQ